MFSFLRRSPAQAPLSVSDIAAKLARDEITLIDVREMAEIKASGKAKGAAAIPLSVLGLKCDPGAPDCMIVHDKPVVLYCASGGRSSMAAQTLSRLGYNDVQNFGGFGAWVAGGGQIERI